MQSPRAEAALERIFDRQREFDARLRDRRPRQPLDAPLLTAARDWSQAVWNAAEAQGPSPLDPAELDRGLALAQRPVFVCGVERSGTTLLRDLLDGHPQLVVVPTESVYFTCLEPALFGLRPDRHGEYLGRQWLERLVFPPPHWLLGAALSGNHPYVSFARDFAAWSGLPGQRSEARIPSWPLAALALAYAQNLGNGRIPPNARMWVEKTPGCERFVDRIWTEFPRAKVLHIVRRPDEVLSSIKTAGGDRRMPALGLARTLHNLARSYAIAHTRRSAAPGRYRLIRYENLVADPSRVMEDVARFLGVDPIPGLSQPTVAGLPALNNSSFTAGRRGPADGLSGFELVLLALTAGRSGARLDYSITSGT